MECGDVIQTNCVERARYEIPVDVNAIINGTQVSDTGTITVDFTEDALDPVLMILLATFGIPLVAVAVQKVRGRSTSIPVRRLAS